MTADQMIAELHKLADQAGQNIHRRVELATALLKDRDWLSRFADDWAAADYLEGKYFGDLCGACPVLDLVALFQRHPDREYWQENGYNLRIMLSMMRGEAGTRSRKDNEQRPTVSKMKELETSVAELGFRVKELTRERDERPEPTKAREVEGKVLTLGQQVKELTKENTRLQARVDQLEKENDQLKKDLRQAHEILVEHVRKEGKVKTTR
jgi:hypothetical protein